jgi:glycyl-tRNA synthetase beta chain
LPPEVLATAMRTHQKYFSCLNPEPAPAKAGGSLAPRFLFVANNLTADDGKTIVAGNERVLRARLADARFFWDQDRKIRLEDRVEALKDRVYYEKLGSVYDKVQRMGMLADFLVPHVPSADAERARRAVLLAKADLSTGMVGEFPELQGVMGRYYALRDGEDPRVANAIAEHYKPLGPNDICPTAPESIVVALADKLDALGAFFFIGEEPTGSRDPFALRRAALGVIRIILENRLRLPLFGPLDIVAEALGESDRETANALEFITDRLEVHLRSEGIRYDIIKAAFLPTGQKGIEDDLVRLLARVDALTKFVGTEDGADLLIAYRRASNIVTIEEKRDSRSYNEPVDTGLFREPEEETLFQRLSGMSTTLESFLREEQFDRVMERLATLRRSVDEFFDKVTVNAEDPALRENRLRLLSRIRAVMNQVADFSQIEG